MGFVSKLLVGLGLGLSLIFFQAVPSFAQDQVNPNIEGGLCAGVNLDINNPSCVSDSSVTQSLNKVVRTIINLLSVVVGVVAVIMIIVGGLRYITSGGSDTSVTGAKNTILYAIIGLIIVALAQILVRFILRQV
ncbi:hypothetical protein HYW36_01805, partial [Candidatus Saccharibacteria bacterium]|nr:hypothetical protein [Candidatus Saccharibacteria bacterium]